MASERYSAAETRSRLIDAGCELLLDFGLHGGMGVISFGDAIERAGVPRTSAYRVFSEEDIDPQDAFNVAVMLKSIDRMVVDLSYVAMLLAELSGFDNSPEGRAAEFRELIRRWSSAALTSNLENSELRALDAITYVACLSLNPDDLLLEALRNAQQKSHDEFTPLFRSLVDGYGLRLRPDFDLSLLTTMIRTVAAVAAVNWTLYPDMQETIRRTGPGGAEQAWSFGGVAIEALALLLLEEDPDTSSVSADLSSWIRSSGD